MEKRVKREKKKIKIRDWLMNHGESIPIKEALERARKKYHKVEEEEF